MLLGTSVGQFALGQTTGISIAALAAVEDVDIAIFVGEGIGTIGDLSVIEADDIAAFAGITGIIGQLIAVEQDDEPAIAMGIEGSGVLNAVEASDVISLIGEAHPIGMLDATEDDDLACFDALAFHDIMGWLRAVEDEDTVSVQAWAVPLGFGLCQPRTVCFEGRQDSDPACHDWPMAA
jgi:hypothetical protein